MKKLIKLLPFFLIACTEPIELDLNQGENVRLAVDAEIDNLPETDTIYLSLTTNFFDDQGPVPATGAQVILSDGSSDVIYTELGSTGKYLSPPNFAAEPGKNYTLEITHNNKSYSGSSFMMPPIKIDSLTAKRLPKDDFANPGEVEIGISFQDPKGEKNHYWFVDFVNGKNEYEDLFEYGGLFNDAIIDGAYLRDIEYGTFDLKKDDTLLIELRTITEEAETILIGLASESFQGGIFDSPPSNVPSNINNGAVGIFVAFSRERKQIIIKE